MKLLVFAGALRTDSCNKKFAREAARLVSEAGHEAEFLDLKDYPMPVYDGDIEAASGVPETTKALSKKIATCRWHYSLHPRIQRFNPRRAEERDRLAVARQTCHACQQVPAVIGRQPRRSGRHTRAMAYSSAVRTAWCSCLSEYDGPE